MKIFNFCFNLFVLLFVFQFTVEAQTVYPVRLSPQDSRDMLLVNGIPESILSQRSLFTYDPRNLRWKSALKLTSRDQFHHFHVSPTGTFVLSEHQLFWRGFEEENFVSIYKVVPGSDSLNCFLTFGNLRLLGKNSGLWVQRNEGEDWVPLSFYKPVHAMARLEVAGVAKLYVASGDAVYEVSPESDQWELCLRLPGSPNLSDEALDSIAPITEKPLNIGKLISGPQETLLIHSDLKLWEWHIQEKVLSRKLSEHQLALSDVSYLRKNNSLFLIAEGNIYAYELNSKNLHLLHSASGGFARSLINHATGSPIVALLDEGYLQLPDQSQIWQKNLPLDIGWVQSTHLDKLQHVLANEPTIKEIHDTVIDYNQLDPERIKRWHRLSRLKSLFPKLSLSRQVSVDNGFDLDRGGTQDPDIYIQRPKEQSTDWSAGVSWDLSEWIFGSDQTSIDVRAKLNTELRRSIMEEATRIYFDRRQLLIRFILYPPEESLNYLNLLSDIEEKGAELDALTGGFFTQRLHA